jgi:hypothetical protein
MVRAIMAGTKTQTRRLVNPQPDREIDGQPYWNIGGYRLGLGAGNPLLCPYGVAGDRLWVRETWCQYGGSVIYLANYSGGITPISDGIGGPWRPSIHMPRWASRITLEIIGVRVERLQDISSEDAKAEGIERVGGGTSCNPWRNYLKGKPGEMVLDCSSPVRSFQTLWSTIHAADGPNDWKANPFVWVVQFRRFDGRVKN